jgi:predicted amidohydrolase YtcJ
MLSAASALAPDPTNAPPAADLIIHNARIWTVNPKQPEADALAVLNGRFVAVGSEAAVLHWRGPHTRIVDAKGERLLPGFNDAHVHFSDGGASLSSGEWDETNRCSRRRFQRADFCLALTVRQARLSDCKR